MRKGLVQTVLVLIGIVIGATGAAIYARGGDRVAQPLNSAPVSVRDTESPPRVPVVESRPDPSENPVTNVPRNQEAFQPVRKQTVDGARISGKDSAKGPTLPTTNEETDKGAEDVALPDNSALIDKLMSEIDAFLRDRQKAGDSNPIPELVEWMKVRPEVQDVAVTETQGELFITFKNGGATVIQVGQ